MKKGKLFIVSGPSGVGKSTVLRELLAQRQNLRFSVSATTRPPRAGETDGVQYRFLDRETFREWIARDGFLEYAEYVGNYYGTPRAFVEERTGAGEDVALDIEVQGAAQVANRWPGAVRIFIVPPGWRELERRLTERGTDSPEKIRQRLLRAKEELREAAAYDYFVVNDTVENAVRDLNAILTAEHCRPSDWTDDSGEMQNP